ncbi:hypothetical protein Hanom_Chr16g01511911 [Helianthus anomalus]
MVKTLVYRKYQRRIHHILTTLRPFRIRGHVTFRVSLYTIVHSMILMRLSP